MTNKTVIIKVFLKRKKNQNDVFLGPKVTSDFSEQKVISNLGKNKSREIG